MAESDDTQILYKKKINMNSNISNECFFLCRRSSNTPRLCRQVIIHIYSIYLHNLGVFLDRQHSMLKSMHNNMNLINKKYTNFSFTGCTFFLSHSGNLSSVKDINYILFFFIYTLFLLASDL